jgi:hypothetical protein
VLLAYNECAKMYIRSKAGNAAGWLVHMLAW